MNQLNLFDVKPIPLEDLLPARKILCVWRKFGDRWIYTGQMGYSDRLNMKAGDIALPPNVSPQPKKVDVWQQQRSLYYQKVCDRFSRKSANLTRFLFCLSVWCIVQDTEYASIWLWGWRRVQMLKFESLRSYQ